MTTVRQILNSKGSDVWSVGPEETVHAALEVMAEKKIGALIVTDEGMPIGIFSERDLARRVCGQSDNATATKIRDVMTPRPVCIEPERTVEDCMALMTAKRIRHLPVIENDRMIGIISIGDAVKAVISHQEFIIEQLENYIVGR